MEDEARILAAAKYKLQKEAFVTGHAGGTITEINLVTLVAPASVLLWSTLQSRLTFFRPYTPLALLVDFLLNAGAILCATTIYASHPTALNLLLTVPAVLLLLTPRGRQANPKKPSVPPVLDPAPIKPFITAYRGTMMAITCSSILAVDFRVFPRRFAKVENWGTSLMDLGVGSFVFSAGLTAARSILKQRIAHTHVSLLSRLRNALRHALPLLVLGVIRWYSVKGLDYAEHVTEYGVDWNFFFTLGLLPPFVALFDSLALPYELLALLLSVAHQVVLDSTDLKAYIFTAPRVDFLSRNREGLASLAGYLAIFLAGQGAGLYALARTEMRVPVYRNGIIRRLVAWAAGWALLYQLVAGYPYGAGVGVSRRLANLPYVLWICAFNCAQLALFALAEVLVFGGPHSSLDAKAEKARAEFASSRLLRAFNRNGLAVFLLANLLTGAVNLALPTLAMGDRGAMGVLGGYMGLLAGVALTLDYFDVSIKL